MGSRSQTGGDSLHPWPGQRIEDLEKNQVASHKGAGALGGLQGQWRDGQVTSHGVGEIFGSDARIGLWTVLGSAISHPIP